MSPDEIEIPPFDSYVLSPEGKCLKATYSTKNRKYNTIESKFRSAEKMTQKKLIQNNFADEENPLMKSIDGAAYQNIKIRQSESQIAKRMTIRELDARMKKAIKKHKDSFTFGLPSSYSKVQSNLKGLLKDLDSTGEELKCGYSNEKQKRTYKNQLLQESFQNKMGLVTKPSMGQLMIGDYIREKKHKNLYGVPDIKCPQVDSKLKCTISDSNIKQLSALEDQELSKLDMHKMKSTGYENER